MSKLKFAKIFELGDYQVLITKEYEPEDNTFKVVQTTYLEECRLSLALGFEKEKKCNECFDNYNEDNAQNFLTQIQSMLSEG